LSCVENQTGADELQEYQNPVNLGVAVVEIQKHAPEESQTAEYAPDRPHQSQVHIIVNVFAPKSFERPYQKVSIKD